MSKVEYTQLEGRHGAAKMSVECLESLMGYLTALKDQYEDEGQVHSTNAVQKDIDVLLEATKVADNLRFDAAVLIEMKGFVS